MRWLSALQWYGIIKLNTTTSLAAKKIPSWTQLRVMTSNAIRMENGVILSDYQIVLSGHSQLSSMIYGDHRGYTSLVSCSNHVTYTLTTIQAVICQARFIQLTRKVKAPGDRKREWGRREVVSVSVVLSLRLFTCLFSNCSHRSARVAVWHLYGQKSEHWAFRS